MRSSSDYFAWQSQGMHPQRPERVHRRLTRKAYATVAFLVVASAGSAALSGVAYLAPLNRTMTPGFAVCFGALALLGAWCVIYLLRLRVELYDDGSIVAPGGWLGGRYAGSVRSLAGYRIRRDHSGESVLLFDRERRLRSWIPGYLAGREQVCSWIAERLPNLDVTQAAVDEHDDRRSSDPVRVDLAQLGRSVRTLWLIAAAEVFLLEVGIDALGSAMALRLGLVLAAVAIVWSLRLAIRHPSYVTFGFGAYTLSPVLAAVFAPVAVGLFPQAVGVEHFVLTSWARLLPIAAAAGLGLGGIAWSLLRGTRARRAVLLLAATYGTFGAAFAGEANVYLDFGRMWLERVPVVSVDPPTAGDPWCTLHLGPHASAPRVRHQLHSTGDTCEAVLREGRVYAVVAPGLLQVRWIYDYRIGGPSAGTH